jgi:hypothetical protein
MKRFFKRTVFFIFFIFYAFCMPTMVMAQGPGGPGPVYPACDPDCNCRPDGSICPIDDGLYLLLFIGLGYGIKKYRDAAKVKAEIES